MSEGETFARMLTRFRERRKLSKTALAKALDVSPGYVYLLEKGRSAPATLDRVQKLIELLELSESEGERFTLAAAAGRTGMPEARVLQQTGPRRVAFSQEPARKAKRGEPERPRLDLNHCVAVLVETDAVEPTLQPGQLALCDSQREPNIGELAMATLADGTTRFGHYYPSDTGVLMAGTKPSNPPAALQLTPEQVVQILPVVGVLFAPPDADRS